MSWEAYVNDHLVGTGKVSKAAILGLSGGVWAASSGYTLSDSEQTTIKSAFKDPTLLSATGIVLGGKKFFFLQGIPERSIYGKRQGDGCILFKTKQAVIVAEYAAPTQAGEATPVVEKLGDYLISVDY